MKFLSTTLKGGLLFMLPLIIVIILLERGYKLIHALAMPLINRLPNFPGMSMIAAIVILILICLIAGISIQSKRAQSLRTWIEKNILIYVPGYEMLKMMASEKLSDAPSEWRSVIVKDDQAWEPGFLVDENEDLCVVFIPDCPTPFSGSIKYFPREAVKELNVKPDQLLASLRMFGKGGAKVLPKF